MKSLESAEVEPRARRVVERFGLWRFDGVKVDIQSSARPGRFVVRIFDTAGCGHEYLAHEWGQLASYMLLEGLHVSDAPSGIDFMGMKVWQRKGKLK